MNRVNKLTAKFSGEIVYISLYKNSTKLLELSQSELGLPKFNKITFKNKNTYLTYCKEIVINLLKNDGIDGYSYSEVKEFDGISKFDHKSFLESSVERIDRVLNKIENRDGSKLNFTHMDDYDSVKYDIKTYYKDDKIKYGSITIRYIITDKDGTELNIRVMVSIMSGQLSSPKGYVVIGDEDYTRMLNRTHINRDLNKLKEVNKSE